MTSDTDESLLSAKLEFSDAVIRVWDRLFPNVHAMIMEACRKNAQERGEDAFVASINLEMAIDRLSRDPNDDTMDCSRVENVDPVLRTWFRIPAPCTQKIFASVKELAVLRDENVDEAVYVAYSVLEHARSYASESQEARTRLKEQSVVQQRENRRRAEANTKTRYAAERLRAR